MKIAHLITAHTAPEQLKRLIKRLQHPEADFYLYIDLKTEIGPFQIFSEMPNVYFIKNRIKIYWGEYSQVQSTLYGMKEILATGKNYDFINFLSGSDYPLQTPEKLHKFLGDSKGIAFMEYYDIDTVWQEAKPRIHNYHLGRFRMKGIYTIQKILNGITPARTLPMDMRAVGRSSWFTLPVECVEYILGFLDKHPSVERYFKFVWGSDEIILQTILYNSPLKDRMRNDNLRYIDWSEKGVNPKLLTIAEKDKIINSKKFFARKFNVQIDSRILDHIDHHLLGL